MSNNSPKNTLLFVYISTHFKEMLRIAQLMKKLGTYNPLIFFGSPYEGWERDFALCQSQEISCLNYLVRETENKNSSDSKKDIFVYDWKLNLRKMVTYILRKLFKSILFLVDFLLNTLFVMKNKIVFVFKTIYGLKHIINNQFNLFLKRQIIHLMSWLLPLAPYFKQSFRRSVCRNFFLTQFQYIWNKRPFLLTSYSSQVRKFYFILPKILNDNKIQLIVIPEHNLFYGTQILVSHGRERNIPAIIVPFTIANTLEWSETFYNDPSMSFKSTYNRMSAHAFPNWVTHYKDKQLILPFQMVLIHEMLNISPKNPWLLNSGDIDFIAVESEGMKTYYRTAGIEQDHLRVIGSLYNDELYTTLSQADDNKKRLCQNLQMDFDKPILLCALPPNQCCGREQLIEFADYEEIVRFLISELVNYTNHYNIVLNLHPRIKQSSIDFISEYPIKIYPGDIATIIPLSLVYIASCSATIRMAVACGIPVINYDLYRYHYDDYTHLDAVLTMFDKQDYIDTLKRVLTDKPYFNKIKKLQKEKSSEWGILDGKAGENLIREIDTLFEKNVE